MPQTKSRPRKKAVEKPGRNAVRHGTDVLTLADAAAYLRVPEAEVLRMVREQGLAERRIGKEWRFLKSALQEWLGTPPAKSGKQSLLALAGAWKDDPDLDEIVREAYRQRGRPITEDEE